MSTPRGHTAKPEDLTGTLGDKPSVPQASFRRVAKVREHLPRAGADVRASAAAARWAWPCEAGVALRGGRGLCGAGRLTSEAVDVEAAVLVGEAGLVGEQEEGLDAGQAPPAALAGRDDGVAHTAVGQPARAAAVQAAIPGGIQLARGGNLCTPLPAVSPGLFQRQLFWGRTQEQLSWGERRLGYQKVGGPTTLGSHGTLSELL